MALLTCCLIYDVLAVVALLCAAVYAYFRYQFQYWKKRGFSVPQEPSFPSGNFPGASRTRGLDFLAHDIYLRNPTERLVACYLMIRPTLIIRDMELVKSILVKDFDHFHDRGFTLDFKKEPLAAHLFALNGQEWRNLRIKLTPTFTSGKMKMMFPTLLDVGKELRNVFEKFSTEPEMEIKEILARFTTDVISSVAFGIETNSLQNPDAIFRKMGYELAHPTLFQNMVNLLAVSAPWLTARLPLKLIPQHLEDFFIGIVRETMEFRKTNNVQRNDFFQLLMQLKDLGYVKDADNPEKDKSSENQQKFTVEQAAAQAFLFFFAGFETSSSTMQFALYELALNPDLQKKVQEEIDAGVAKENGQFTYETVMHLDLLDRVVDETLRKYPPAAILIRQCGKEYRIPDTDQVVKPGESVLFPVMGYHRDPEFFPEPEKFDPDRFLPEIKATRPHYAYLPFGEGPRNCIGNRFGLMQTKVGLALILADFTVSPSKRTPIPIVFDPTSNILSSKDNIYLKVTKR